MLVLSNLSFCHNVFKKPSVAEASKSVYTRERVQAVCRIRDVLNMQTLKTRKRRCISTVSPEPHLSQMLRRYEDAPPDKKLEVYPYIFHYDPEWHHVRRSTETLVVRRG